MTARRVLIVDDHAGFRAVARALLERRGFAVVGEADSVSAGLEAAQRVVPEAVLLDVRLADGDPDLAVLLVSTDEPFRDPAHVFACGARGFLLKSRLPSADLVRLLSGVQAA
jgi:DNA-binding NarL/FixJ family response regulator